MREQGVDEARLRGEVVAQRLGPAILARDLVEEALELGDVAVNRLLEAAIGAVLAGDLVKGLLAGRRIEALGERLALATLVTVPHLGREIAVHQPADVERQRLQRIAAATGGGLLWSAAAGGRGRGRRRSTGAVGAVEQVRQPAVAAR